MIKVLLIAAAGGIGLANALLLRAGAVPLARFEFWTRLPQRLPLLILAEAALGLVIFLAAAVITSAAPPRGTGFERRAVADAPSFLSQPVDDLTLTLSVRPNKPGENVFTIGVLNTRRPPPAPVLGVTVRFTPAERDGGTVAVEAQQEGPGRYWLSGSYLDAAGPWRAGAPRGPWAPPPHRHLRPATEVAAHRRSGNSRRSAVSGRSGCLGCESCSPPDSPRPAARSPARSVKSASIERGGAMKQWLGVFLLGGLLTHTSALRAPP